MPAPRRRSLVALVALLAVAGCGLLIPPQRVVDPLGLNGSEVPLAPVAGAPAIGDDPPPCDAVATAGITHCASSEAFPTGETANVDDSGFGGLVRRVETSVGTRPTMRITTLATEAPPASVVVSEVRLDLAIEDAEEDWSLHPTPFAVRPETPVVFALQEDACATEAPTRTCAYVADEEAVARLDVPIEFTGEEKTDLMRILTEGGTNRLGGSIGYAIEAEADAAPAFVAEVELDAPEAWIHF